jgi:hypothetical protein
LPLFVLQSANRAVALGKLGQLTFALASPSDESSNVPRTSTLVMSNLSDLLSPDELRQCLVNIYFVSLPVPSFSFICLFRNL